MAGLGKQKQTDSGAVSQLKIQNNPQKSKVKLAEKLGELQRGLYNELPASGKFGYMQQQEVAVVVRRMMNRCVDERVQESLGAPPSPGETNRKTR